MLAIGYFGRVTASPWLMVLALSNVASIVGGVREADGVRSRAGLGAGHGRNYGVRLGSGLRGQITDGLVGQIRSEGVYQRLAEGVRP